MRGWFQEPKIQGALSAHALEGADRLWREKDNKWRVCRAAAPLSKARWLARENALGECAHHWPLGPMERGNKASMSAWESCSARRESSSFCTTFH